MKFFITGTAGFIGFHLAYHFLSEGHTIYGFDALTPYYDLRLKLKRHEILSQFPHFYPTIGRLEDFETLKECLKKAKPEIIIHLAAQAGVRYSLQNPRAYLDSNLIGFFNLLEAVKTINSVHFLLASTSSAYGATKEIPFRETQRAEYPLTLYAATKRSNEVISHAYSHLFNIPTTVFRFFTVYGPFGRPDMALFKFTKAILEDSPIEIYNNGQMFRDFTYISDIVKSIALLINKIPPSPQQRSSENYQPIPNDTLSPVAPWRLVNIGNNQKVSLLDFIETLEDILGKKAKRNYCAYQAGDIPETWADCSLLKSLTGYSPNTSLREGIKNFVEWYLEFYKT